MVNKMFQEFINNMNVAIDNTFGIIDEENNIIACNNLELIGKKINDDEFLSYDAILQEKYTFKSVVSSENINYTIFVAGNDSLSDNYASIIAVAFSNIKNYYDDKYNRTRFVKDLILDNILPGDIYIKARELCFDNCATRTVIVVRTREIYDMSLDEALQNIFPDRHKDFIININEKEAAIVKEISDDICQDDVINLAESILATLFEEYNISAAIGIGSAVNNIKSISRSFKEAQMSLEVGKVFENEKRILSYDNLGVARLVYQLPTTLCDVYLSEILKHGTIDMLDKETLFTIQKFFENNLNVSEASRQLYIHRNTLLYRLEKVKKVTGLDLKIFDHAAAFKIALMVNKYLKSNPNRF